MYICIELSHDTPQICIIFMFFVLVKNKFKWGYFKKSILSHPGLYSILWVAELTTYNNGEILCPKSFVGIS
jgi:hypothetical protein